MKIFVTGASGFVGSAVVHELISAGYEVLGLARSEAAATSIAAAGAEVLRGALDDLDSLRSGARAADGVIHTAFIHDFSQYAASAEADRCAIETLGEALAGSGRPFVVTAGTGGLSLGRPVTEEDAANPPSAAGARVSEPTALSLVARKVRVSVMRLPPSVHGEGDHGFVPRLITIAGEKGVSAYPGDGSNRWAAVHRLDAARLFRLAVETAPAGSRLHGVGDERVSSREIAEMIGRHLNLPVVSVPVEKAGEHFGWLGAFFSLDIPASSALTQQRFGWRPVQPGLLADLDQGHYFNDAK
ncbi:MAG: SDR family oxidoreductase [Anaerolineae bacterium]|nr:SDR family oxidoreductase [Anaerolineae bacterium]